MAAQPEQEFRSSLSTNTAFLERLRIDQEPVGLLGRYFAQIAEVATSKGVGLSVESINALHDLNRQNRDSWRPLVPALDPDYNRLDDTNAFCLIAYDETGEPVASGGCRLYNWTTTNYLNELESLRMFYSEPARSAELCETCVVSAAGARNVTGVVVYAGAAWCHPKVRGMALSSIIPRTSKALALAKWNFDYMVGLMLEESMRRGLGQRFGYATPELAAQIVDRSGTARSFAVLSMPREDVVTHVRQFSAGQGAQVDALINRRLA
jgi:hypothetical protein